MSLKEQFSSDMSGLNGCFLNTYMYNQLSGFTTNVCYLNVQHVEAVVILFFVSVMRSVTYDSTKLC